MPSNRARLFRSRAAAAMPRAEIRTSRSVSPLSILGTTMAMLILIRNSTTTNSSNEKPWLSFPTRNVTIVFLAAGGTIRAIRNNIVGAMVAGALINVWLAPGIGRNFLLQIGTIPAVESAGFLVQGLKPLLRVRIAPDIEAERIQSHAKALYLSFGGFGRRLLSLFNVLRQHEPGEQNNNRRYDNQLDQRKALSIAEIFFRMVSH